jgi:hypothetical protein
MSITITIAANDALDLQRQLRTLLAPDTTLSAMRVAAAVPASPPVDVPPAPAEDATPKDMPVPVPANGKSRGRPRKAAEDVVAMPVQPVTNDVPVSVPDPAPAPVPAPTPVSAPMTPIETRTRAVALLRSAYATGAPGAKVVSDICDHFKVSKLVDVPLTLADELLAMASQAHVQLVGPIPAP